MQAVAQTVIFLHIPKAAGTTLHDIIDRQFEAGSIFSNNKVVAARLGQDWNRMPAEQRWEIARSELIQLTDAQKARLNVIKGHMVFGWHEFLPNPCVYITLLRDPLDRVISLYYYIHQLEGHYLRDEIMSKNMGLKDFVSSGLSWSADNGQTRMLSGVGDGIGWGQCSDETLEVAKRNIREHFALVGLFERFDETVLLLRKRFGWRMPFYVKRNVTRRRSAKRDIPDETREAIIRHNKLDVELYRYACGLFDTLVDRQGPFFKLELSTFSLLNRCYGTCPFLERVMGQIQKSSLRLAGRAWRRVL